VPTPVIHFDQVSLTLGGQSVLEDIQWQVHEGEFMGVIGPNGAGKTTLFRLLLGLIEPTAGRVIVLGNTPERVRDRIGYVPQFANFRKDFPLVVEEAILMGSMRQGNCWGRHTKRDRIRAHELMEQLDIRHLDHRALGRLSGGELQRVLMARALISNPSILLLDEPTASVDHHRESTIFSLLEALDPAPTILLISHDLGFITPKVSRVACLNRTLSVHTPESLTPQTMECLYGQPIHAVHHHSH
jgi:zinc transport system ATP-binding protein